MFRNLRLFFEYREQNKVVSKVLKIRRNKTIEMYFLFGLYRYGIFEKLLKRKCKCYIDYYKNKEIYFEDLNYIICRIISTYNILGDKEILEREKNNFDNYFVKKYVENKISELIENDTLETDLRAVK